VTPWPTPASKISCNCATPLEPFIVGLVAQSISSKEVGQLRLTLMDMREALDAGDAEAGMNAYIAFHEELFALTSNPIFQNVVQQTSNALKQSAQVLRNSPEHLAERLQENDAVVRAIRNKNSALASAEMRKHILQEGLRMSIRLTIPDDHLGS
jgi:GntR family transcriptional repressor for pyruvate dehydrogenase complex